jgi:hypothetical protein
MWNAKKYERLLPSARALHLVRQSAFGVRIRLGGCGVGYGYALATRLRHSGYAYAAYTSRHDSSPTLSPAITSSFM